MAERSGKFIGRVILRCLLVLAVANALFLLVRVVDWWLPRPEIKSRLRAGFNDHIQMRMLPRTPYPWDKMKGADQYTDFVSMQIELLGNTTVLTNALAPRILSPEGTIGDGKAPPVDRLDELFHLLNDDADTKNASTYTRFWHGQSTVMGIALLFLPADGYHAFLLLGTLGLIAATGFAAALKDRALFFALLPLLFVSFFLCGQTRFAQLMSYGPAQLGCWGLIFCMVAWHERLSLESLLLLATLSGAVEAFLDMMISVPLVAGIYLSVAGTILALRSPTLRSAVGSMAGLSAAWWAGFVGTYAAKLALTIAVLGWSEVVSPFVDQVKFRVGLADVEAHMPKGVSWLEMIWWNITNLASQASHLTFDSTDPETTSLLVENFALLGAVFALWQLFLAYREKRPGLAVVAGAGYLGASAFILVWIAAFPEHTWRHSWFMVRMMVIWMAAGWGWGLTTRALRLRSEKEAVPEVKAQQAA